MQIPLPPHSGTHTRLTVTLILTRTILYVQIFVVVLHTKFVINWVILQASTKNELGSEPETANDVWDYSWCAMTSSHQSFKKIFFMCRSTFLKKFS